MANRLSHSAISRFQRCPKEYQLHYLEGWRETVVSGALVFGSAMDAALNLLLSGKEGAEQAFDEAFKTTKINDKEEHVPTSENIVYSSTDFDGDLLHEEDFASANKNFSTSFSSGAVLDCIKDIANTKKHVGWENVATDSKKFYNYLNWLCLRRKGHVMLRSYREEVIPKVARVLSVQRQVSAENAEGDSIIGYVDAVIELKDGRVVIFDNKTSSIEYDEKAVLTSPQLTLYVSLLGEEFKTRNAGFIVMRKGIIKNKKKVCKHCFYEAEKGSRHKTCSQIYNGARCNGDWIESIDPKADIQILIDEIPTRAEDIVMENFDETNEQIKRGIFTRNFNSCVQPWGRCSFWGVCWQNDTKGLEKKKNG